MRTKVKRMLATAYADSDTANDMNMMTGLAQLTLSNVLKTQAKL